MNLDENECHEKCIYSEEQSADKHKYSRDYICAKKNHCGNPTTNTPTGYSQTLDQGKNTLQEENKEERHEVEGTISPECFIKRSEPAGVAARTENQQPEQRKPKVGGITTAGPPSYAAHHIHT